MKAPRKYIQVSHGATTAVYCFKAEGVCLGVITTHREPKPMLFRRGRRICG